MDVDDVRAVLGGLAEPRRVGMVVPLRELPLQVQRLDRRDVQVELPPPRRVGKRGLARASDHRHAVRAAELDASPPSVRPRLRRLVAVRPVGDQRAVVRAAPELHVQARLRAARPVAVERAVPLPRIRLRPLPSVAPLVRRAHHVLRGVRRIIRHEPHVLHLDVPFRRSLHCIPHEPVELHAPPHVKSQLAVARPLFHPPRHMSLCHPLLRLAFRRTLPCANLKLALLRHDHEPHRPLQHLASVDLDRGRKPAFRQHQCLFRRSHRARERVQAGVESVVWGHGGMRWRFAGRHSTRTPARNANEIGVQGVTKNGHPSWRGISSSRDPAGGVR